MPYCTQQDLIERFGEQELIELTDEHGVGEINATQINRAIEDADGLIDGYLTASRYDMPLIEQFSVLTRVACNLVRHDLYDVPPEHIVKRYESAVAFLRDVSTGKVSLGVKADGSKPSVSDNASMQTSGSVFGRDDSGFL
ncbi:DUF1320 domain-containing protein [Cardiobacterium sp. AH-315-I02]|nr:DUF1320 domain-containing protein [Cardiobacterium sp. AH-315-I02]